MDGLDWGPGRVKHAGCREGQGGPKSRVQVAVIRGGSRHAAIEDQGEQGPLRNEKVGVVWYAWVRLSLYQSTLVVWWVKCWMADSDSHIPTTCLVEPVPRCLWKCGVMLSWALIGMQKGDVLLEVLNSIYQKVTLLVQMTLRFVHWGEPIAWTDVISLWWRVARNVEAGKVLQYLQVKIRGRIYSWWGREYCGPPPPIFILTDGMALPWRRSDGGQVPGSYVQGPRGQPLSVADQPCSAVAGICHRHFFLCIA